MGMQIHNDGRAYAMVIRNDGEILWASHDKFKEHLQERSMVNVVNRECEFRIDEQERLLESGKISAVLEASPQSESPEEAADGGGAGVDAGSEGGNAQRGQPPMSN